MENSHGSSTELVVFYLKPLLAALEHYGAHPEFDQDRMELHFYISRVAMSGSGYIEGDEEYGGTVKVLRRTGLGLTGGVPLLAEEFVVLPNTLNATCTDCPAGPTHTVDDAREFLTECDPDPIAQGILAMMSDQEILDMAYDQGMGEGDYVVPDNDYAFQECQHVLETALDMAERFPIIYESDTNLWLCDGEIIFDPGLLHGNRATLCPACQHSTAICACQPVEEYEF